MISGLSLSLILLAGSCAAGVVPTAPGPGQTFKEGSDCTLSWNLDTTGKWTSFNVQLMSGSNTAMQFVTDVFKGRDGTKGELSYTWKCPAVTPNADIYFYQFTQPGEPTTWTTRFTIASPSGAFTPPANLTQPDGAQIPWGIGQLSGAGAGSASAQTSTTTPSPSANITALTTPMANLTSNMNSTMGTVTNTSTSTSTSGTRTTATAPTQSTSSYTGSNSRTSPSNSQTSATGSDKTLPSSGASALVFGQAFAAALSVVAVAALAC